MSYIIYLRTIKAVFLDEGPTVTALVMVVNGLRVTTEYVYESKCVCVCVCVFMHNLLWSLVALQPRPFGQC